MNRFPFAGVTEGLHLVISWVEALHGRGEPAASLGLFQRIVGGRRASLLRLRLDTAVETFLERAEPNAADASLRGRAMSFPQHLLGLGLGQAQAGTVWYLSEVAGEIAAEKGAEIWQCLPDDATREIAVIVLEPRPLTSDIVELQFPARLSRSDMDGLAALGQALSRGWRHRSPGVHPQSIDLGGSPRVSAAETVALLGASNPAGLTRSEYRVCELVSRGLGAKAISGRLRISESTVRSHLRSIYAKTRTSGQRELICRLLDGSRAGAQS